jgi:hypothetical protein
MPRSFRWPGVGLSIVDGEVPFRQVLIRVDEGLTLDSRSAEPKIDNRRFRRYAFEKRTAGAPPAGRSKVERSL